VVRNSGRDLHSKAFRRDLKIEIKIYRLQAFAKSFTLHFFAKKYVHMHALR
jgi:hypothetical protein